MRLKDFPVRGRNVVMFQVVLILMPQLMIIVKR